MTQHSKKMHVHALPIAMVSLGVSLFLVAALVQLRSTGASAASAMIRPAVSVRPQTNGLAEFSAAGTASRTGVSVQLPANLNGFTGSQSIADAAVKQFSR